jgi:hypothetical protein
MVLRACCAVGVRGTAVLALLTAGCGVRRSPLGDGGEPTAVADDGGVDRLDPSDTDGGGGAASNGSDGGGDKSRPTSCGSYRIPVTNQTPEVLVVLDKSGSMREAGRDRWGPSVAAVDGVVHALPEVRFGLLTFPGDCSSLTNPDEQAACTTRLILEGALQSCEPGRVTVPVAEASADTIRTVLSAASPIGATPTAAAIDSAAANLEALPLTPESGSRSILLVTDGAPNCALGIGGAFGVGLGPSSAQPEAVDQTVDAIARAAANGVKTHVIGYDSQSDAYLAGTLDRMAAAGGTGDRKHRPVEDQASLVSVLGGLTKRTLLCELRLDAPTDPARITITFDGKALPRDDANGWGLAADGVSLSLRGGACDAVTASPNKAGLVDVACPPPPPPSVEVPDAGDGEPDAGPPVTYI